MLRLLEILIPDYAILISTPSTLQRLMDEVLRELHPFAVAYLDDILIHSATWEDHLGHLSRVLQRIRQAGLRIKAQNVILWRMSANTCVISLEKERYGQCSVNSTLCASFHTTYNKEASQSLYQVMWVLQKIHPKLFHNRNTSDGVNSEKNG